MPSEVLLLLAQDRDARVRSAVAQNTRATEDILRSLFRDQVAQVRARVAEHPKTPLEVLQMLEQDPEPVVRRATQWVARHLEDDEAVLADHSRFDWELEPRDGWT